MLYVLEPEPTSVCSPVAVTSALSPSASPVIAASGFLRASPLYSLLSDPVVTVTVLGFTVSIPSAVLTFVKFAVLSSPSAFLMMYLSLTSLALDPALTCLPFARASMVKPSGRPLAVTSSLVRAVPSYSLVLLAAVRMTAAPFVVTVRVPGLAVTV